jgi:flagellar biosynthesis/type III secretory pathway chaperone
MQAMNNTDNNIQPGFSKVSRILHQHLTETERMYEILHQEFKALKTDDLGLFEICLQNKQAQLNELKLIEPQLTELARELNGQLCKESIGHYIDNLPAGQDKSSLKELWQRFQKAITQCNEQNLVNNRIMTASRTNLEQILNILRGNSALPSSPIYGSSGKQDNDPNGRSIAIA